MNTIPIGWEKSNCPVCEHKDNKAILFDNKCYVWYNCEKCDQQYKKNTKQTIVGT